jgi:hypothetical protein
MAPSFVRVGRFVRRNWLWVLALPPMVLVGELIHGGFELLAIVAQGGQAAGVGELGGGRIAWLIDFRYWPGPSLDELVAYLAPFVAWVWIAALGSVLLARVRPSFPARLLLVLCGLMPTSAMSTALALGVASRGHPCLLAVGGEQPLIPVLIAALSFPLFAVTTWRHFRRLWGGLSALEFGTGYALMLAAPWLLLFTWR